MMLSKVWAPLAGPPLQVHPFQGTRPFSLGFLPASPGSAVLLHWTTPGTHLCHPRLGELNNYIITSLAIGVEEISVLSLSELEKEDSLSFNRQIFCLDSANNQIKKPKLKAATHSQVLILIYLKSFLKTGQRKSCLLLEGKRREFRETP